MIIDRKKRSDFTEEVVERCSSAMVAYDCTLGKKKSAKSHQQSTVKNRRWTTLSPLLGSIVVHTSKFIMPIHTLSKVTITSTTSTAAHALTSSKTRISSHPNADMSLESDVPHDKYTSVPHLEKGCVTAKDQIFRGRNFRNVCLQFDDASKCKRTRKRIVKESWTLRILSRWTYVDERTDLKETDHAKCPDYPEQTRLQFANKAPQQVRV